jgi:predicted CDP-diglyceride synthetase/phosphatidate cytidylyltransferase
LVTVPAGEPATVQVRTVFEVPVTEAVIPKVPPTVTLAGLEGLVMETTTAAADVIVMLTEADLVSSATLVAVMSNVAGVGTDEGAL